jgi:hypothetical protein
MQLHRYAIGLGTQNLTYWWIALIDQRGEGVDLAQRNCSNTAPTTAVQYR